MKCRRPDTGHCAWASGIGYWTLCNGRGQRAPDTDPRHGARGSAKCKTVNQTISQSVNQSICRSGRCHSLKESTQRAGWVQLLQRSSVADRYGTSPESRRELRANHCGYGVSEIRQLGFGHFRSVVAVRLATPNDSQPGAANSVATDTSSSGFVSRTKDNGAVLTRRLVLGTRIVASNPAL